MWAQEHLLGLPYLRLLVSHCLPVAGRGCRVASVLGGHWDSTRVPCLLWPVSCVACRCVCCPGTKSPLMQLGSCSSLFSASWDLPSLGPRLGCFHLSRAAGSTPSFIHLFAQHAFIGHLLCAIGLGDSAVSKPKAHVLSSFI